MKCKEYGVTYEISCASASGMTLKREGAEDKIVPFINFENNYVITTVTVEEQIEEWKSYDPTEALGHNILQVKGRLVDGLGALYKHFKVHEQKLIIYTKPRKLVVDTEYAPNELVLVPLTLKISTYNVTDKFDLKPIEVNLGKLVTKPIVKIFVLSSSIVVPSETSDAVPYLNPYWFVGTTSDAREANMHFTSKKVGDEVKKWKGGTLEIPVRGAQGVRGQEGCASATRCTLCACVCTEEGGGEGGRERHPREVPEEGVTA